MIKRKIIKIDEDLCTGCGDCITACAEGALELVNGKAKVVRDSFCDGLGACIGECPVGALTIEEREAYEFDEDAVKEHLGKVKHPEKIHAEEGHSYHEVCNCPSAKPEIFSQELKESTAINEPAPKSMLGHWPVQLLLVPETAPFLKDRELIVLADCVAVAYANLHKEFLNGKAVVMGCPKFDNTEIYRQKLAGMIKNSGIKSISVVHMEVPCCFGFEKIISEAISQSEKDIPFNKYIIGIRGDRVSG